MDRSVEVLIAELTKSRAVLKRLDEYFDRYTGGLGNVENRTTEQAIVVADLLASIYTCTETMFLRVSQFFENSLRKERWHRDLLEKMSLDVPGVRPHVLRDETVAGLAELLSFRHFKRYYFEFHYEWARLDFISGVWRGVRHPLADDLEAFAEFLKNVRNGD